MVLRLLRAIVLRFLLANLLLPSVALAVTDREVYVDTDCANNGNGSAETCAASAGAAGAYSNLYNALDAETKDLVSNDRRLIVWVEGATADTSDASGRINLFAGYTDATRYLLIQGRDSSTGRHDGVFSTGKYRLQRTGDQVIGGWTASASRLDWRVDGFQLYNAGSGSFRMILKSDLHPGDFYATNMIMRSSRGAWASSAAIRFDNTSATTKITNTYLINNIVYDSQGTGISWHTNGAGSKIVAYNNTIINTGDSSSGEYAGAMYLNCNGTTEYLYIKNNVMNDCYGNCYTTYYACSNLTTGNNISSDATSPDTAYRSINLTFEDEANDNYHLAASDTSAIDDGSDLSSDAQYPFSNDIDGDTRTGTWDIGADEYVASGPSLLLLKHAMEN